MNNDEMIRKTESVCPVCLKKIPAVLKKSENDVIRQEKTCQEHGMFEIPVWNGRFDYAEWISREMPLSEEEAAHCDGDCRACNAHGQGTCCVILEVTKACNLSCTVCFAHGGEARTMPSVDSLKQDIDRMAKGGEEVGSPDWLHAAVLRYNEVLVRSGNTPCYHFALDLCTAAMNELISLCDHHLVSRMK